MYDRKYISQLIFKFINCLFPIKCDLYAISITLSPINLFHVHCEFGMVSIDIELNFSKSIKVIICHIAAIA